MQVLPDPTRDKLVDEIKKEMVEASQLDAVLACRVQALILMAIGVVLGLTLGLWSGQAFMESGRPFMFETDKIVQAMILLVTAGLLGGALSIRRITSVDPIIALGQEQ